MPGYEDFSGMVFGRLTILEHEPTAWRTAWCCRCECGKELIVLGDSLRRGVTQSCGCLQRDRVTKHGGCGTPEYRSWQSMKDRCGNPKSSKYDRYGGRGIRVCQEWIESFEVFLRDMGPRPSMLHTLDRIDNNLDYGPANCRWATKKEQSNNRNDNHRYEYGGESLTIPEWSRKTGVDYEVLRSRLRLGWSIDKAISAPVLSERERNEAGQFTLERG